ncbi:uncharacterized protein LOC135841438 [Planococcus citri]|uniref:uncharacterized protein LOC135841438 n=1 Tax=Planococcus citri TaxID=170843 RepID=UPI0031F92B4A
MLGANFCCVIGFFAVFFIQNSSTQNRNLCDICECIPSYAEPSYVNCNCKKSKVLILKDEDGETLANTKMLNISTCNFVSFPPNGFPKSKKLKSVQIKLMKLFHLNSGVFPYAVNLNVEDVDELIVDGFQGQSNLANIEIRNSVLSELAEDSFRDAKNLEKLSFQNVTIGNITSGSLVISSNNTKPWIKFANCKIDDIQSDGISLQVSKFEIVDSSINVIRATGITVIANDSIDIIRSTFGAGISPESFQFKSNKINIVYNDFESLPSLLLKNVELTNDKKINFMNNLIHDVDLGGFILNSRLDKIYFVKNKIMCDCTPRKTSILKVKEVFPGLLNDETNFDAIIEHNSCKNYNGMHLSEFRRKFLARILCNDTDVDALPSSFANSSEQNDFSTLLGNNTRNEATLTSDSYAAAKFSIFTILICICAANIF